MAVKRRRKRKLKTSVKLFAAFFLVLAVFSVLVVYGILKKDSPPDVQQEQTLEPQNETTFTQYNEFIDIKTVTVDDERTDYPVLKGYDDINLKITGVIDSIKTALTLEKAYFNQSYFSAVMRDAGGKITTLNYSAKDSTALTLSSTAPAYYSEYGDVPFYLDGESITLYTQNGDFTVPFSQYDGIRYLPYVPPAYTPVAEDEKVIALTFDDGPHRPDITAKILDKLTQRRAKTTFFVLGFECPDNGDILKRVVDSGCEIGNHSWRHEKLNKISRSEALESITKTQNIVYEKTGIYPRILRPPYGDEREDIMHELGLFHVEWCVDPEDWKIKDSAALVQHVKEKAQSGYVVLMHDIYDASGYAALELIDWFCDNGWRLVTVSELFDLENREFTTEIFRMK